MEFTVGLINHEISLRIKSHDFFFYLKTTNRMRTADAEGIHKYNGWSLVYRSKYFRLKLVTGVTLSTLELFLSVFGFVNLNMQIIINNSRETNGRRSCFSRAHKLFNF